MTVLITQRSTRSLRKRDVIKCLAQNISPQNRISVANFQDPDRSQNYKIFNVRTIVLAFEISITVQPLTFLTHPVFTTINRRR